MNNAKIWLVVKPGVGIPLMLSAVVIGSVAIHVGVLTQTTIIQDAWNGDNDDMAMAPADDADVAKVAYVTSDDGTKVVVQMPDGTLAHASLDAPVVASATVD